MFNFVRPLMSRRRAATSRRPATRNRRRRLGCEQLEDRAMLTTVIAPHFGAETLVANGPFTSVMNNATVNLLLWGTNWGTGAGQTDPTPVISEAVSILTSKYLKGLTEYDSNGIVSAINAYVDNATSPPAGFNPGNLVAQAWSPPKMN